jgi:hypothetical protein
MLLAGDTPFGLPSFASITAGKAIRTLVSSWWEAGEAIASLAQRKAWRDAVQMPLLALDNPINR